MSSIQLFQNAHTADIVQMMWNGQISIGDIQEALCELQASVDALTHPANLVVIVAPDTQLPSFDSLQHLSHTIDNKHLTG